MVFHRLDDHDGIVHHEADGQHQAEQRQGVDGETQQGEKAKVPMRDTGTASSGIRVARQPCRKMKTTRMTEDERFKEGLDDFLHALRHRQRGVQSNAIIEVRRESFFNCSMSARACFMQSDGVGAGELVDGQDAPRSGR